MRGGIPHIDAHIDTHVGGPGRAPAPAMATLTNRLVPVIDPDPDHIHWPDVAEGLAKTCRFSGQTMTHYSVAQHSVIVENFAGAYVETFPLSPKGETRLRLYALLHDAHKYVLGDISRPIKIAIAHLGGGAALGKIAHGLDAAIFRAAGLDPIMPVAFGHAIKAADNLALATERRDLLPDTTGEWPGLPDPARDIIKPAPWPLALDQFSARLNELLARAL